MMTPEMAATVRRLRIRTSLLAKGAFAGEYRSVFKGRGIEFADLREYQPGDDIRFMDWKVTARTGTPFVRQFVEEREMNVLLVVDASPSCRSGPAGTAKNRLAAEVCGLVAAAAAMNHDRAGLVLFTDGIDHYLPPAYGHAQTARLLRDVLYEKPSAATSDLAGTLAAAFSITCPRSLAFILSDFDTPPFSRELAHFAKNRTVVALRLTDPLERGERNVGLIAVTDPESGRDLLVDTRSRTVREQLARKSAEAGREAATACANAGVPYREISTDKPCLPAILGLLSGVAEGGTSC